MRRVGILYIMQLILHTTDVFGTDQIDPKYIYQNRILFSIFIWNSSNFTISKLHYLRENWWFYLKSSWKNQIWFKFEISDFCFRFISGKSHLFPTLCKVNLQRITKTDSDRYSYHFSEVWVLSSSYVAVNLDYSLLSVKFS